MKMEKIEQQLTIHLDQKPIYNILFEQDFLNLKDALKNLGYENRKLLIVTETNVAPLYLEKIKEVLEPMFREIVCFTFQAGEKQKQLSTVSKIYTTLIEHQFDRKDILLALGGGVTGDLTGFAAATYLRGVDFVQVPTSLLAQVDSSIGGKTGVDYESYKNMVGAFYQPSLVYINTSTLKTLPEKEFISGLGEVIKHGLIKDRDYFHWIKEHKEEIKNRKVEVLQEMIYRSCQIKGAVVERDPKEQGERALLNFGHTLGHSIEKLMDFSMLHGDCVVIGSELASFISWKRGLISKEEQKEIQELFAYFHFDALPTNIDPEEIVKATKLDKKMEQGQIKFILLKQIGEAFIDKTVTEEEMLFSLSCYGGEKS